MNANLYIGKQESDELWDCSSIMSNASWYTSILTGQPGKLTFSLVEDNTECNPDFGNQVRLDIEGKTVFIGYIFVISEKWQTGSKEYIAYDQTRYLKNPAYYTFINRTGSEVFKAVCKDNNLKTGLIEDSSFAREVRICDGKSSWELLDECINDELTSKGNYFIFFDDAGELNFRKLDELRTDIIIGDESLLQDYSYNRSIDEDTFNNIIVRQEDGTKTEKIIKTKIVSEIKSTDLSGAITKKISSSIPKFGKLTHIEITQNLTESQMQERGVMLFYLKNRPTEKLVLNCVGDKNLRAGNGIIVNITKKNLLGYYVILSCTHNIVDDLHSMEIEIVFSGVYDGV